MERGGPQEGPMGRLRWGGMIKGQQYDVRDADGEKEEKLREIWE